VSGVEQIEEYAKSGKEILPIMRRIGYWGKSTSPT